MSAKPHGFTPVWAPLSNAPPTCHWCGGTEADHASTTTHSSAPPLSAEQLLADMRAAKAKLDAMGPVPVEIVINPGEQLTWLAWAPAAERKALESFGNLIPVRPDPDVPLGEWWVKKSDGSHEAHKGGTVKR